MHMQFKSVSVRLETIKTMRKLLNSASGLALLYRIALSEQFVRKMIIGTFY